MYNHDAKSQLKVRRLRKKTMQKAGEFGLSRVLLLLFLFDLLKCVKKAMSLAVHRNENRVSK